MSFLNSRLIKSVFMLLLVSATTIAIHNDPWAQNTLTEPKVVGAPLILQPGVAGGELRTSSPNIPQAFNPLFGGNQATFLIHAGLLEVNPLTLQYEAAVASSYTIAADNSSIAIELRNGIAWSDGTPLTSDDVVYTYVDLLQNQELLDSFANFGVVYQYPTYTISVTDDNSLTFNFPDGNADQMILALASQALLPRHVLGEVAPGQIFTSYGVVGAGENIVGVGPYRVAEYEGNGDNNNPFLVSATLERNPFYWKQDENGTQLPYIDTILLRYFPQGGVDLNAMLGTGEFDLLSGGGTDATVALSLVPGVTMVVGDPFVNPDMIIFNQDTEDPDLKNLFRDVRFRQAIAHTLDRPKLVGLLTENSKYMAARETAAYFRSPYFDDAANTKYAFNLARAAELLDNIGLLDTNGDGIREFPGGKPVKFDFNTNNNNSVRVAAGEELTGIWSHLGLDVNYLVETFAELQARFDFNNRHARFDIQLIAFGAQVNTVQDTSYLQCYYSSQGFCHVQKFSDPNESSVMQARIDEIFTQLGGALSASERSALERELQTLISEDLSQIPLWSVKVATGVRAPIQNVQSVGIFGQALSMPYFWRQ